MAESAIPAYITSLIRHFADLRDGTHGGSASRKGSAMLQEANWNRSSSFWDTSRCKRPNAILAASSGFVQQSMIASVSNRWFWKGCRPSTKVRDLAL